MELERSFSACAAPTEKFVKYPLAKPAAVRYEREALTRSIVWRESPDSNELRAGWPYRLVAFVKLLEPLCPIGS
jgi:hypothetical protein